MNADCFDFGELISNEQLGRLSELVYKTTGIQLDDRKKSMVTNRLRKRLKANSLDCFDEYYDLLTGQAPDLEHAEWNSFLECITTHETYLYRDQNQWDWFAKEYIPWIVDQARNGQRKRSLRIWSAACSRGDEAYTVACCLADKLPVPHQWNIEILGTDIGIDTIQQANEACFSSRSMKRVPTDVRERLFHSDDNALWFPKDQMKKWVKFQLHNLIEPLPADRQFDLVFLKNVLIYFDQASKKMVLDNVLDRLMPDGLLALGPAEGVKILMSDYERVLPWLYRNAPADAEQTGEPLCH